MHSRVRTGVLMHVRRVPLRQVATQHSPHYFFTHKRVVSAQMLDGVRVALSPYFVHVDSLQLLGTTVPAAFDDALMTSVITKVPSAPPCLATSLPPCLPCLPPLPTFLPRLLPRRSPLPPSLTVSHRWQFATIEAERYKSVRTIELRTAKIAARYQQLQTIARARGNASRAEQRGRANAAMLAATVDKEMAAFANVTSRIGGVTPHQVCSAATPAPMLAASGGVARPASLTRSDQPDTPVPSHPFPRCSTLPTGSRSWARRT